MDALYTCPECEAEWYLLPGQRVCSNCQAPVDLASFTEYPAPAPVRPRPKPRPKPRTAAEFLATPLDEEAADASPPLSSHSTPTAAEVQDTLPDEIPDGDFAAVIVGTHPTVKKQLLGVRIIAVIGLINGIRELFSSVSVAGSGKSITAASCLVGIIACLSLFISFGLWNQKLWAWRLAVINYVLGLLFEIFSTQISPPANLVADLPSDINILSMLVSVGVLVYLFLPDVHDLFN